MRSGPFVGRERELAALREAAADRARAGTPSIVVIAGEPGIGKTRLVAEFADELRSGGAIIATGHGVDLAGGALPYGVVAGLVRQLRAAVGLDRMSDILGPRAAALGSVDPTFVHAGAEHADRRSVFEAVQHLVLELAREQLVCLVLEDMHWSDATSLDLVTYLATTVDSGRLLLVATTRPDGASRLARLVALGELLSLRPLADTAVRELAADLVHSPDEDLLDRIIALGEGIPLYVEEMVAVQAVSPSEVPTALALTFAARLAGLSKSARQALDAVAVAQADVPADLLRNVLRAKRSVVADAIEEVASRGLLDVLGQRRVRFHHELLRRAVADALSPLVRAEWHRRWALTLQRLDEVERSDPTVLAALAHHWFSAGDPDQAVPAAVAAGQAASAIGAATESAVHWHRALLHWHRAGDAEASTGISHENALIEGTTVLRLAGAYTELLEVLAAERARAHADPVLRLWLDAGLAATSSRLGNIQRQVVSREGLPTVLDLLAAEPKRPVVRATLFWLWWDAYDADRQVVERIIDLLDEQADPSALPSDAVGIGLRRARFALTYGDADEALQIVQGVLARDDALHPVNQPVVEALAVWLLFVLGRLKECIEAGERALTRLGGPELAGMNWAGMAENLAAAHAMAGNLDRAEDLMRTVLGTGELFMRIVVACDLVALLGTRDRVAEAEQLLTNILEHRLPGPGDSGYRFGVTSQVVAAQAALDASKGDYATARDLLQPVLGDRHLTTDSEYLWPVVLDAARLFNNPPALEPLGERTEWAAVVRAAAERVHKYGALGPGVVRRRHRPPRPCAEPGHSRSVGPSSKAGRRSAPRSKPHSPSCGWRSDWLRTANATAPPPRRLAHSRPLERIGAHALADRIRAASRRHRLRLQDVGPDDDGTQG